MSFYKNLKKILLDIFFPESCIVCNKFGSLICEDCLNKIKGYPKNDNYKNIDWIFHSLNYKNIILKKILFSLKYNHVKSVSKYLSRIIYFDFLNILKSKSKNEDYKNIILVPIPISNKRLIERDYNQSEILIRDLIEKIIEKENINLKENIYTDLLIKQKHTIKFADTHRAEEREMLIKNAFTINQKYDEKFLEDKIIFLIDDITTTGATFYESRNTLINFGAKKENIFGYAIAH